VLGQFLLANDKPQKFHTAETKGVSTPASREEIDNHKDVSSKVPHREAVGSFMHLAAATRPDMAFALIKAARIMGRRAEKDWDNIKRLFGTCDQPATMA